MLIKDIYIKKSDWKYLALLYLISAAVRLKINFSTEYIGGGNGAYYLVLVRSILENGTLFSREFPLIFWLEAGIAYIPLKLGLMNLNSSIDLVARMFDSIVPPLSVIPAYMLTQKLIGNKSEQLPKFVITAFSVLFIPFFMLVSDFQKNSLGLLWLFGLLFWLLKVHEKPILKNILMASLFFLLTAVTHYGCIGVAIAIVTTDLLITQVLKLNLKQLLTGIITILFVFLITFFVINIISPWRLSSMLEIPSKIFNNPVIVFLINKQSAISPLDIITIVVVNIIAITSLVLFFKKSKSVMRNQQGFIASMILLSLFLASPLLGLEFAQRLYFFSYLTALPLLAFIYININSPITKRILIGFLIIALSLSTLLSLGRPNYSNMNETLYSELIKMKNVLPEEERSLIVARHGMEFWSTWIFRNNAVRQTELAPVYWRWFNKVYFLIQKKDISPFGPAGIFGGSFREPTIPQKSRRLYSGEYFELYLITEAPKDYSIFKESFQ